MSRYVDVVVFVSGDPNRSIFTYCDPDSCAEIGMMVSVPYGKKIANGIVVATHSIEPAFPTRPIQSLIYDRPVIPPHLLFAAQWMSDYYFQPLRNCVETVTLFERKIAVRTKKNNLVTFASPLPDIELREEQHTAYTAIAEKLDRFTSFLLFGITGSGKTEVYLRIIDDVLKRNKQILYLVPEIALTPQTISRVESRFPGKTSVLNSQISDGERYTAFVNCISGDKPIVIGSRSALFAPFFNLGLIIIDEFHDHSYKQESAPPYSAITVAEKIAEHLSIPIILGSATPRVSDYAQTQSADSGKHTLLRLNSRSLESTLPHVTIVDMREELKKKNFSSFSDILEESIHTTLSRKEQILLFLNRRGVASSILCRMCGWSAQCPHCSVALTLHNSLYNSLSDKLVCHHCDYMIPMMHQCPSCASLYIKALGSGTERIQSDLIKLFPDARIVRMDRDTTTRKGSHEQIYRSFVQHEYDVLIGTQMITKGWDIPNVTLVGIMNADTALHTPFYSAAEQTFSIITQVSGRAGRGNKKGSVVLQTYNPDHYALVASSLHSYDSFYTQEIEFRKDLHYPPFSQLAQLVISEIKEERALEKSQKLVHMLESIIASHTITDVEVLGPSSCIVPKLRNKWYYQILIKGKKASIDTLLPFVPTEWKIIVDPESAV